MRLHFKRKKGTVDEWLIDERIYFQGRQIRKRETFKGSKAEVEERCLELRKELRARGEQSTPITEKRVLNFGDVLGNYRDWIMDRGGMVDPTRYNALMDNLGGVPLECLADRMQNYLRILKTAPSKRTRKPLANASLNRLLVIAKAALNHAVKMDLIDKNPLTQGRFEKLPETPRDFTLTRDQRDQLLKVIERRAPHLLPITRFALQVPCRKAELVNMRRGDLDLDNDIIRVRSGTTKNGMGCDKLIPPDMREYFTTLPRETEYLFYRHENGKYFPLGDFKKAWWGCLEEIGLKNALHFHDTRRIAATDLVNNGTPERVVATLAGWKSTEMLTTYYAKNTALHLVKFPKQ